MGIVNIKRALTCLKVIFLFGVFLLLQVHAVSADDIFVSESDAIWNIGLNTSPEGSLDSSEAVPTNFDSEIFVREASAVWNIGLNTSPGGSLDSSEAVPANFDSEIFVREASAVWNIPQMAPTTPPLPSSIAVGQGTPDLATKNHFIDAYNRNGGINVLGIPATEVHRAWGYLVQDFPGASGYEGGIIIYNPYQKYAYYIHSEIWERYYSLGGPKAKTDKSFELGPPTSDIEPYVHLLPPENSKYGTPFRYQKFEGGALELNITSGKVFEVHGGILQKWRELGYAASNLGLPTTDEKEAAVSPSGLSGRYSVFEGGIIHWIREKNEIFVIGKQTGGKKIADKYYAEGGSGGWLGFPVSEDYVNVTSGYLQVNFEGGYITTVDGTNYMAYPKDVTNGPTITIESPSNSFITNNFRIDISGSAYSENGIKSMGININSENRINRNFNVRYNSLNRKWTTNIPLEYGFNLIEVTAFDTNSIHSSETIQVYSNPPDFTFAHITDVHVGNWLVLSPLTMEERESRITRAIDQINNRIPKPDFILITGDLVDSSKDEYFSKFNNIFRDVKAYIVPGNHDRRTDLFSGNDGLNNYSKYLNNPQLTKNLIYIDHNKSFEHNGYQFIGLDSGSDYDPWQDVDLTPEGTGLDEKQMDLLKSLDYTTPKIIFMHNPAINTKNDNYTDYVCNAIHICNPPVPPNKKYGGNDATIAKNRTNFIDYSLNNNVQLVITGHTHENHVFKSDGSEVNENSEERPLFIQTGSVVDNKNKEIVGLTISNTPPLYGYRIIDLKDGKAYPRQFKPIELPSVPNTDLTPQFESTDRSKLTLKLRCPANLHVYDSQGRHTGLNSSGGETNIPDSFYIGRYNASDPDEAETIFLYNATEEYRFEIIANLTEEQKNSPENESFNFTMDRQSEGIRIIESFQNVTLNENTTASLRVNITTKNPNMSLDYNGDTITDETKDPNSIETNYAPTAAIIYPEIGSIYNESEIVEFNGTGSDPENGILTNHSLVWYSDIDGTIGSGETFSTVNLSAGSHIITLMVNDSLYLYGASSVTITIADTAPPVTTLTPLGILGNNSWYISYVNVTLTATDTQTGSGVNITEYSFDNVSWTTYINPFNITSEGITTVYYHSTDYASNVESTKNQTIKIDKTPPTSITNPQAIVGYTYINFTWTNPPDTDFNRTELYLNGTFLINVSAPQNNYNIDDLTPYTLYELSARTVDAAGNINETWVNRSATTAPLPVIRFINGTVIDSANKTGIPDVIVSANTTLSTKTNISGFYSFAVTSGTYNLTAKFDPTYYMNNTITISTVLSAVVAQDIELVKKPTGNITGSVKKA